MSQKTIDPRLIRHWVYSALRQNTSNVNGVLRSVYNVAQQEGLFQPPSLGSNFQITDIPPDWQNGVRAVIWDLIIQGIIVPGVPNDAVAHGLPGFVVTDWGNKCLDDQEYLTFDAARYIARIRERIPGIDAVIEPYLKDALASFRVGAYLSSAVMTGVASERALLLLRDAVQTALPTWETLPRSPKSA